MLIKGPKFLHYTANINMLFTWYKNTCSENSQNKNMIFLLITNISAKSYNKRE